MVTTKFPDELYESDEFGVNLITTPEQFTQEVYQSIEAGFDEDFDPTPKIWNLVDPSQGIYQRTTSWTADGKWHHRTDRAKMIWSDADNTYIREDEIN